MDQGRSSDLEAFEASLSSTEQYPLNLRHAQELRSVLRDCHDLVQSGYLFKPETGSIWTWCTGEDGSAFGAVEQIDHLNPMQQVLSTDYKDSVCRFLYVQNRSSRTGLGCSKDQLTWLLTYHQVSPAVVDLLSAFDPGYGSVPLETSFHARSMLREAQSRLDLPQLGRSNFRFEYCLRLIGVEKRDDALTEFQHVGAYHSMDVKENRSTWLILKAREDLRKEVEEESRFYQQQNSGAWSSVQEGFLANMNTNHVLFKWCSRNWAEHIDDLDEKMRPIAAKVTLPRMDDIINEHAFRRRDTSMTRKRRAATGLSQSGHSATVIVQPPSRLTRFIQYWRKGDQHPDHGIPLTTVASELLKDDKNTYTADAWFNFDVLQNQHVLLADCRSTMGALKSNIRIMNCYQKYIRQLTSSKHFKKCVKMGDFMEEIHDRLAMVKAIEADLQSHAARLDRLMKALDNVISLLTSVLNYKEVRAAEHFTRHAQDSTTKMEIMTEEMHEMAKTTELQTVSMHIITAVALFFLPVTFVAVRARCLYAASDTSATSFGWDSNSADTLILTEQQSFFDSNILDFSRAEKRKLGQWTLNMGAFSLFFYVSIPIMFFTIMCWGLAVWWHRTKRTGRQDAAGVTDPEKQMAL